MKRTNLAASSSQTDEKSRRHTRRQALTLGGAAAAAALGMNGGKKAQAATGDPMIVGQAHDASAGDATSLSGNVNDATLAASNTSTGSFPIGIGGIATSEVVSVAGTAERSRALRDNLRDRQSEIKGTVLPSASAVKTGDAVAAGNGWGILGIGDVVGAAGSGGENGLFGISDGGGIGVLGSDDSGIGVGGVSTSGPGVRGVGKPGVHGISSNGSGVRGDGKSGVHGTGNGAAGSIGVRASNIPSRLSLRTEGRVQMNCARKVRLSNRDNLVKLPKGVNAASNAIVMAMVQGAPGNGAFLRRAFRVDSTHVRLQFNKKPGRSTIVGYWVVHTG